MASIVLTQSSAVSWASQWLLANDGCSHWVASGCRHLIRLHIIPASISPEPSIPSVFSASTSVSRCS